jgi:hypothetical protein
MEARRFEETQYAQKQRCITYPDYSILTTEKAEDPLCMLSVQRMKEIWRKEMIYTQAESVRDPEVKPRYTLLEHLSTRSNCQISKGGNDKGANQKNNEQCF